MSEVAYCVGAVRKDGKEIFVETLTSTTEHLSQAQMFTEKDYWKAEYLVTRMPDGRIELDGGWRVCRVELRVVGTK